MVEISVTSHLACYRYLGQISLMYNECAKLRSWQDVRCMQDCHKLLRCLESWCSTMGNRTARNLPKLYSIGQIKRESLLILSPMNTKQAQKFLSPEKPAHA